MILVTGGTGLVGSHLLYQLTSAGENPAAIHRKSSNLNEVKKVFSYYSENANELFEKIRWLEADIIDITTLETAFKAGISQVYHCAAMVSFNPNDYQQLRKTNIDGTANIINLSLAYGVSKLCYVSSIVTLDEVLGKSSITETNEWNPDIKHHGYAISKYGAEMEVWRGSQEGLDVIIVNPGVILGSGYWEKSSNKIITSIAKGFKFYTLGVTGFVGVKDVINVLISLMKSDQINERFILVSENMDFKSLFFAIADQLKVKRPAVRVNKATSELAWRILAFVNIFSRKSPSLTKHSARSAHHKNYYSSEKILSVVDFKFDSIDVVIKEACKNYSKDDSILS